MQHQWPECVCPLAPLVSAVNEPLNDPIESWIGLEREQRADPCWWVQNRATSLGSELLDYLGVSLLGLKTTQYECVYLHDYVLDMH